MHLGFAINILDNSQKYSLQKQTNKNTKPTNPKNKTKKSLSPSWKKQSYQTTLRFFTEKVSDKPAINTICCNVQDTTNLSVPGKSKS